MKSFNAGATLTQASATASLAQGLAQIDAGATAVDCAALAQFDSSALAVLLAWQRAARARGVALGVAGAETAVFSHAGATAHMEPRLRRPCCPARAYCRPAGETSSRS